MSMRGDKQKNGPSTFSDQITSRLHRWVQRTTTKGRNREKGTNIRNLRRENNHAVKDNDLNIKQCSPPPQKSNPCSSKDTRTILELEKALKDLINNCVTNAAASSPSGSDGASFVGDGVRLSMTTKYITKDNGDEVGSNRGETSEDDDIADVGCQTQKGRHGRNVDGALSASGLSQQNLGNYAACETTLVANPGATPGETVGVEKKSLPSGTRNQPKDSEKNISKRKEHTDVTLFRQTDEGNTKACEDRNHPSTSSSETTDVYTSVRNTNNGLSAGSSIKTQHRMHYGRQKTVDGKGSGDVKNSSPKQKPPLRRIQSEGDSIAKRFSFNNSDVSEFAKTCIRHAQKKRLSQANSLDSDVDSLSDMVFGEAGQQASTRPSPEFAVPRNLPLRSAARDSGNVSDFDPGLPDITASRPSAQDALQHSPLSDRPSSLSDVDRDLQASRLSPQCGVLRKHPLRSGTRDSGNVSDFDPTDQHVVSNVHTTLSDRLSSLSFPLERNKAKNINKQSFFKNKSKSNTAASEDRCSPQSSKMRAANRLNSPTFRKFPCQPVFYVPRPGESSAPLAIPSKKTGRSKSLTESKHGNSEHLI